MDTKEIVKYLYEEVISNGLIEEVEKYVSEDYMLRVGKETYPIGLKGMKQHIIDVRKTYPDFSMKVINQFYDNGYVISEIIAEGTHLGEFLGIKPTGKLLTFTGVNVDKVLNARITEHSGAINTFETFIQNGIIKPHNETNREV